MQWTNLLGIYPDSIEKIFDICEGALEDAREVVARIGYDNDLEHLDFELHEEVISELNDVGMDANSITNAIIGACLNTTRGFLEGTELFRKLGLNIDGYINGYDSHLYVAEYGINTEINEGKLKDVLYNKVAMRIWDAVYKQISEENRDIPDDHYESDIWEGLKDDEYDVADILACLKDGEVKGAFRELVDSCPVLEQKDKPKSERERD